MSHTLLDWLRLPHDVYSEGVEGNEELLSQAGSSLRLRLLAEAAMIDSTLAPAVVTAAEAVCNRLGAPSPLLFVLPRSDYNAFCFPMEGVDYEERVAIGLHSSIVRDFPIDALRFVIGHEVGHFLLRHQPPPALRSSGADNSRLDAADVLRLRELSADRVGLLCVNSMDSAYAGMLQMASGLSVDHVHDAARGMLEQLRMLEEKPESSSFSSMLHPPIPLRVRNLLLFSMSNAFRDHGGVGDGSLSIEHCNRIVLTSYLKIFGHLGNNSEVLGRLAFWSTLLLFVSDGRLDSAEQTYLRDEYGPLKCESAIRFLHSHASTIHAAIKSKIYEAAGPMVNFGLEYRREVLRKLAAAASLTVQDPVHLDNTRVLLLDLLSRRSDHAD